MGTTHWFPELVGHQVASYMVLTGDVVTGQKAKEMGLVLDHVAGSENVKQRAMDIAKKIASQPSVPCVRTATQALRMQLLERLEQRLIKEADSQAQAYASEELKQQVMDMKKKLSKQ